MRILVEELGVTHISLGNCSKALTYLEEYYYVSEKLYNTDLSNEEFIEEFAICCISLGDFFQITVGDIEKGSYYYHKSKTLLEELVNSCPNRMDLNEELEKVKFKLSA